VSTRSTRSLTIFGSAVLSGVLALSSFSQSVSTDEGKRKVKTKVAPVYPDLAKRMSVTGKVKIEVVISPDGRVKSVRALGGHPLLVQACQDAMKEWKFMPGPEESTQVMECNFTSSD
jgi:TonB family protein